METRERWMRNGGRRGKQLRRMRMLLGLFLAVFCFMTMELRVCAREGFAYDFLEFAPDGMAWTIREPLPNPSDAGNSVNPSCWYPDGEVIVVGERKEQAAPGVGEHAYSYLRQGVAEVWKWVVTHSKGKCIHNDEGYFHGIPHGGKRCLASYYSGWNAYCADCGEKINLFYVYAGREKIRALKTLDLSLDYYYLCPTCDHMEQGNRFEHVCRSVSANRYQVVYLPNAGDVSGRMQPSFHVYNNAEVYEGKEITPVKTLNLNSFQRKGYVFRGWNLAPDGSGESFADGQEILNLSEENYDAGTGKGIVRLYAQWERVVGTLLIDPGEGSYLGETGITAVSVGYGEEYHLLKGAVIPPRGFQVVYDVRGGEALESDVAAQWLEGWRLESPFHGILQEDSYQFLGMNGDTDVVTARYASEGILLPLPVREGYSFGGWYLDASYQNLAGREGDRFTPKSDVTLHAQWVDLVLTATLNLTDHDGKGAVDLAWHQRDERQKTYLIWQRKEGEGFHRIYDVTEEGKMPTAITFEFTGKEISYEIPHVGFYELEAAGAQGSGVGAFQGGLGGYVKGKFYLEAGDVIRIFVGGQSGSGGGGKGASFAAGMEDKETANGGGSTRIESEKKGTLLVAGGGGSASPAENGGAGGSEDGLRRDGRPEGGSGDVGGGAGWIGGAAGTYQVHVHTQACLHVHQGDAQSGGPCYEEVTEECTCQVTAKGPFIEWKRSENCYDCLYAGRNGYGSIHPKCWWIEHQDCGISTDYGSNGWWECVNCGYVGYKWGSGQSKPVVRNHDYSVTTYVLNCDQIHDCGEPQPIVSPARGGSSYVREELALSWERKQGRQEGDGFATILPLDVGFQEQTEWKGVYAPDLAPPRRIDPNLVELMPVGRGRLLVQFERPEDLGTVYRHQAESYLAGADRRLSASNVTVTDVVTGVEGYYYLMDERENTVVTKANAENSNRVLRETKLEVELRDGVKYLHLAPVDRAGNVGGTTTVDLRMEKVAVCWGVETAPIQVTSRIGDREYGSTHAAEDGTYYVRADGSTPFVLSFEAELLGMARQDYQIDHLAFTHALLDALSQGSYHLYLPHGNILFQEAEIAAGDLGRMTQGRELLAPGMYAQAIRSDGMKKVIIRQSFVMDLSCHGRKVLVTPSAAASFEGGEQWSDDEKDFANGVILIGDGEAPEVAGWEGLGEAFHAWQAGTEGVTLELMAKDDLSGVAAFWIEVFQVNTTESGVFHADENGRLRINLKENDTLFSGDVTLLAHAIDHVGNAAVLEYSVKEFELSTEIVRLLEPHAPVFKRGESGMLKITLKGYADTLEIEFPEAFDGENPGISRVIRYDQPKETVREEILFMIPLRLAEDGAYQVVVRARKGEEVLEGRPELSTFSVAGTLLGEIRTRLR